MNLSDRSSILRGQTIGIAGMEFIQFAISSLLGTFNHRPIEDVIRLISNHGGQHADSVRKGVTVVLSTEEMAFAYENPYKLQFMPAFQKDIETAQMYSYVK